MKRHLLISALFACFIHLGAQKVDLDRFTFSYEYRDLPSEPLDSTFETYRIAVTAPYSVSGVMDDEHIASLVNLEGYTKEKYTGNGIIRLTFEDIIIESSEIVETYTTRKRKDGTEYRDYRYEKRVEYTMRASCDFSHEQGQVFLREWSLLNRSGYSWSSSKYKTREEATNYYTNNQSALENRWVRERVKEAIANANRELNRRFGYPIRRVNSYLWLNDHRKHPETAKSKAMWAELKPVLTGISGNKISQAEQKLINEAIGYFNAIKTKYKGDGKREKKMRYSAYYNNAVLYMVLGNMDKAIEEANGLVSNDYDVRDGEQLIRHANAIKDLYEKNGITSRHFER